MAQRKLKLFLETLKKSNYPVKPIQITEDAEKELKLVKGSIGANISADIGIMLKDMDAIIRLSKYKTSFNSAKTQANYALKKLHVYVPCLKDGVFAESKMKIEPTPGPAVSSDQSVEVPVDVDHVEHENKIGSKSSTRWTENEMYSTDESDTDLDAAFNTKTSNSVYTFINVDTNVKSTREPNSYVNNSHNMYKVGQRADSNQPTEQAAAKSGYKPNIVFFDELSASEKFSLENETLQTKFTTGNLKDQSLKESNKSTINKPIETSVDKPEPVVSQAKTNTCHEEQENITGKLKDLDSNDPDLPVSIVDMEADFCTVNQPSIGVRNKEQKQSKLAHEVLEPGDLVYEKEALLHYRLFAQTMTGEKAHSHGSVESKSETMAVAAIDIGTTYSGYALSIGNDFESNPPEVGLSLFYGGRHLITKRNPTVLLLDRQQEFVAFGYDAENIYCELAAEDKHRDYYYFRSFITNIYAERHLTRDTLIKDEHSKTISAMKVLSLCLKYLVDDCLHYGRQRVIEESDIEPTRWVLTVPATTHDGPEQFMREAARAAGLKMDALTIALELETALQFCMHLPIENLVMSGGNQNIPNLSPFSVGQRLLVVDVGGHTINTTVYVVVGDCELKELIATSEGLCGAKLIDEAHEDFWNMIVGKEVFDKFKSSHLKDWIDFQRQFELKKRCIGLISNKQFIDKVCSSVLDYMDFLRLFEWLRRCYGLTNALQVSLDGSDLFELNKAMTVVELQTAVHERIFAGKVTFEELCRNYGMIRIPRDIMHEWYTESCEKTVQHVKELFEHETCKGTDNIILVGGFAESIMLQKALNDAFPYKRLVVPEEAEIAVLKGAVHYGYNPISVVSRVTEFSYGILGFRDLIEGKHQNALTNPDPLSITDKGCTLTGRLKVEVSGCGKDRVPWVKIMYGGSELVVHAEDDNTGQEAKTNTEF
ncbi:hypothetical protein DPMN_164010 [Dreissena polymorpha]|uniref:Heat shock 70 kDa protein 12A n=1 Tax=Dreissena polymorpha TaxID=45954 RepID=A0A9D4IUZ5_DREPO|nr:hypothetical protein DPMN_164010 [Dreissena polymorpha]